MRWKGFLEIFHCVAFFSLIFFWRLRPSMLDLSRLQYATWNLFTSRAWIWNQRCVKISLLVAKLKFRQLRLCFDKSQEALNFEVTYNCADFLFFEVCPDETHELAAVGGGGIRPGLVGGGGGTLLRLLLVLALALALFWNGFLARNGLRATIVWKKQQNLTLEKPKSKFNMSLRWVRL